MKKRRIIKRALGAIGIASYAYDVSPDEYQDALDIMDGMSAQWASKINTGYIFPADGVESDPDDEAGIPDSAYNLYWSNLAVNLAPGYGKTLSAWLVKLAKDSYDDFILNGVSIPQRRFPTTMPIGHGSGRSVRDNPFFYRCGCGSCGTDCTGCLMPIACYDPMDGLGQTVQALDINLTYQVPEAL